MEELLWRMPTDPVLLKSEAVVTVIKELIPLRQGCHAGLHSKEILYALTKIFEKLGSQNRLMA